MQQKKALYFALVFIAVFAVVMVVFYKIKEFKTSDPSSGEKAPVAAMETTKSPYEGIYTFDSVVEAKEKRLSYFSVNRREDHLGASVKVDSVGSDHADFMDCADVKFEEPVFFVRCELPDLGSVSFDGKILKEESSANFAVEGKLLWQLNSQALVEKNMRLAHSQE